MKIVHYKNFDISNSPYMNKINEEEELGKIATFWQNTKYGLSKILGRYKVGGRIFGKGKVDEEANKEMQEIMKKASNKLIKDVYSEIMVLDKEFPNCRKKITFIRGCVMYAQLYESIVAATEKKKGEDGYMDPVVANQIITDLRKVVKKHLDVDLKSLYSAFESKKEEITEEEIRQFNEDFRVNEEIISRIGDALFGKKNTKNEVESERIKTLKSNKLPLILTGAGVALGALGWITSTDWFKDLVTKVIEHPDEFKQENVLKVIDKNLKVDPNGWSYTIQNNGFMQETGKSLNFNQPVSNLKDAFAYYGSGDQSKGIEFMSNFLSKEGKAPSVEWIEQQLSNPDNKTVGDIFNKMKGTYGDGLLMNQNGGVTEFIATKVFKETRKVLVKKGFKTISTSVIGGWLMALSPYLTGIGIALVATGAIVKLLRMKGLRQSRAKTLNDLLQSLEFVKVDNQGNTIIEDDKDKDKDKDKDVVIDDKEGQQVQFKFYTETKKLFQSIISLEEQISNKRVLIEGDTVLQDKVYKLNNHTLATGESYLYTNTKGKNAKPIEVILISTEYGVNKGNDGKYLTSDDVKKEQLKDGVVYVMPKTCKQCNGTGKKSIQPEVTKLAEEAEKIKKAKGELSPEYKEAVEKLWNLQTSHGIKPRGYQGKVTGSPDVPCTACNKIGKFELNPDPKTGIISIEQAMKQGNTLEPFKVNYKDLKWLKPKQTTSNKNDVKADQLSPPAIVTPPNVKSFYKNFFTFEGYVQEYYNKTTNFESFFFNFILNEAYNPVTGATKPGVGGISKNTPGFDKELTTPAVGRTNTNIINKSETQAVAAWKKILKVYNNKDLNLTELAKELKIQIKISTEVADPEKKKWRFEEFDKSNIVIIGKQVMENEATIGKPISFQELIREKVSILDISKHISLLSRIIMAFTEDVGLAGAYGLAGDQIKNFIKAYNNMKELYPKLMEFEKSIKVSKKVTESRIFKHIRSYRNY